MGMISKVKDLFKSYKCWRIIGELDFPMEDCNKFDENSCFYFSRGETCPGGSIVKFASDDELS